jgi:hypothetical protein
MFFGLWIGLPILKSFGGLAGSLYLILLLRRDGDGAIPQFWRQAVPIVVCQRCCETFDSGGFVPRQRGHAPIGMGDRVIVKEGFHLLGRAPKGGANISLKLGNRERLFL